MENKNYKQEELMDITPTIVKIGNANIYSVPLTYFNTLSTEILEKIRMGQEPAYFFSHETPYKVPSGYFDNLAKSILQKVLVETEEDVFTEMESISPLLNTISKRNPYTVPEGFFDKITAPVAEQTKPVSKVVSITAFSRIVKYAVAAVIITILAAGMYLLINKDVPAAQSQQMNATAEVKKLSEDEIAGFLKTNFSDEGVTSAFSGKLKESDFKKSVKEISDKEIQRFLKEEGETDAI